ncbi:MULTISPECIES: hypothetical protein [Vibrio]|nr:MULTISPECIES: hypothetical protein [Vibrio]
MYSVLISSAPVARVSIPSRLPAPNRHIHSHGHHRTPQKSG